MSASSNPPLNPQSNPQTNAGSTPGAELKFGLWAAPESPLTVEYSLGVIEEIRHDVAEGFQRLSRGGIEVGGVLYGTHDDRTVRVLGMRPIACEHARGPGFVFSDKDRINLHEQLLRDKDDPQLEGLVSVGWYLSHTRTDIFLNDADQEIYSIFFPSPSQITMVVRPGRNGAMRAGFFVRDPEGAVKADRSFLEFSFPERLSPFGDRSGERAPRERGERRPPMFRRPERAEAPAREPFDPRERAGAVRDGSPENTGEAMQDSRPLLASFGAPSPRSQPKPRKWLWLVGWAVVLIVAALFGLRYWMATSTVEPISLSVLERNGQLQIEWNHAAAPVVNAVSGTLEIVDGAQLQSIRLGRPELAAGNFTYQRKTGDIEVRMTVENASGVKTVEASRYLGRAPESAQNAQELADLEKRRDELQAEVQRLHQENDAQAAHIQQLERLLRVLQARLGIDSGKQ